MGSIGPIRRPFHNLGALTTGASSPDLTEESEDLGVSELFFESDENPSEELEDLDKLESDLPDSFKEGNGAFGA